MYDGGDESSDSFSPFPWLHRPKPPTPPRACGRHWLPKSFDKKNGGYHINYGATGQPNGRSSKMIVTQARQVWLFSRAARSRLVESEYPAKDLLTAAEHGYHNGRALIECLELLRS